MSRDKHMREQLGPGAYIQQGRTNTPPSGMPQGGTVIVRRTIKRRSPAPQLPASTHNAGHYTGLHPEDQPFYTGDMSQHTRPRQQDYTNPQAAIRFNRTYTQQTQAPDDYLEEEEFDDELPTMMPRSALLYQSLPHTTQASTQGTRHAIPPRRTREQEGVYDDLDTRAAAPPKKKRRRIPRLHWYAWLSLGMILMIFLWTGWSNLVAFGQRTLDDWHYLRPRVFQTSAVVGANDSPGSPTYFEALNLNRHVYIFECPGGDCTRARIINGPTLFGDGQDLSPITITFKDVNGDGKLDMVVHVEDQTFVMINDGQGNFRPPKPGEHIQL